MVGSVLTVRSFDLVKQAYNLLLRTSSPQNANRIAQAVVVAYGDEGEPLVKHFAADMDRAASLESGAKRESLTSQAAALRKHILQGRRMATQKKRQL